MTARKCSLYITLCTKIKSFWIYIKTTICQIPRLVKKLSLPMQENHFNSWQGAYLSVSSGCIFWLSGPSAAPLQTEGLWSNTRGKGAPGSGFSLVRAGGIIWTKQQQPGDSKLDTTEGMSSLMTALVLLSPATSLSMTQPLVLMMLPRCPWPRRRHSSKHCCLIKALIIYFTAAGLDIRGRPSLWEERCFPSLNVRGEKCQKLSKAKTWQWVKLFLSR